ncbi:conserved hypothetical protein [Trichinella spiralis]|uniref:hypothetical protein n=1 Tax=Trichinella spiralis TaxID=6334 RepID=UPI0001EFB9BC|nr:conserved hypothetical protein [Trichinella spiralis]
MLPYVQIVLLIFFSTRFLKVDCANLKQVLRDYEFLDLSLAGKTVHKRWLDSSKNFKESKELIFHAFRRDFRIFLSVKESLLASNFKAYVIDSNGQSMHFGIDPNEFYAGRVFGNIIINGMHVFRLISDSDKRNAMSSKLRRMKLK